MNKLNRRGFFRSMLGALAAVVALPFVSDAPLEAVGMDSDGIIKPIDELSHLSGPPRHPNCRCVFPAPLVAIGFKPGTLLAAGPGIMYEFPRR